MDLRPKPGSGDVSGARTLEGNSAKNRVSIQSFLQLPHDLSLYTGIRHVDELPTQGVPSYDALDASIAWSPTERLRASLTVQNLNDAERVEFNDGRRIERSAYARVQWTF
jgi:outer membrane receptor protein involved in Fe transport